MKAIHKSSLREIKNSLGRFLSIFAIIMLGVGFFSGLKVTKSAMVTTADQYLTEHHLYDFQLISTLGFTLEQVDAFAELDAVDHAEGAYAADVLCADSDGSVVVLKAESILENINQLDIVEGEAPQNANECVLDARYFDASYIGTQIELSDDNTADTKNSFAYSSYLVTGIANSPIYLSHDRGNTSLGDGTVAGFMYLLPEGFDMEAFTSVYLTAPYDAQIYSDAYNDWIDSLKAGVEDMCETESLSRYDSIIADATAEYNDGYATYQENLEEYQTQKEQAQQELDSALQQINDSEAQLEESEQTLSAQRTQLEEQQTQVQDNLTAANSGMQEILAGIEQIDASIAAAEQNGLDTAQLTQQKQALQTQQEALQAQIDQLQTALNEITAGFTQLENGEQQLQDGKTQLEEAKAEYTAAKKEADAEFEEAQEQLNDAKQELDSAKADIEGIEKPDTYVLTRQENVGYVNFENDASIVEGVANVFPIFFFFVAALVCMTTMTRMADEKRGQIGVLKALGYSKRSVAMQYVFYSGFAAVSGCVAGFFIGSFLFPYLIWYAYGILYGFAPIVFVFDLPLFLISLAVSLICSVGATLFSCMGQLSENAAEILRPKAPKAGKRVFLEKIPIIWKRLKFLHKVSYRNIFRYKKRFIMMLVGIGGCTALLVTGFGLQDSIQNIVNYQYDEISVYDYEVSFSDPLSESQQQEFAALSQEYAIVHKGSYDITAADSKDNAYLIASDSDLGGLIDLHEKDRKIEFPKTGYVVVTRKLAEDNDISVGDTITITDTNYKEMQLTVSDICDNYVYNYIYTDLQSCEDGWGYTPDLKTAYANGKDGITSADFSSLSFVNNITISQTVKNMVTNTLDSMNYIVLLVIICAGALAFIVLYNLTNINITERIREIATIKVLGFYNRETAAYVFREILILTVLGSAIGLLAGKFLHAFVMSQIKIDMIYFDLRITALSYILSFVMTLLFAAFVSFVMYFKLQKIDMAQSMKSIE